MKYTALRDEQIFALMLHINGVRDASIIRCLLYQKAFTGSSGVPTSKICSFCSFDSRSAWRFLNRLQENQLIGCVAKGREKLWYLIGAAAISRVVLNPDFYSGRSDL